MVPAAIIILAIAVVAVVDRLNMARQIDDLEERIEKLERVAAG